MSSSPPSTSAPAPFSAGAFKGDGLCGGTTYTVPGASAHGRRRATRARGPRERVLTLARRARSRLILLGCDGCQRWEVVPCVCGDAVVCIAMQWCWLPFPWWCVPACRVCPCLESEMEGGEKGPIYCGTSRGPSCLDLGLGRARAAFRVADRSIADAEAARVAVLPAADVRLSSLPSTPGLNPIPTMNVEVVGLADTGAPKIKIAAVGRSTSYDECCVISPPPKESMAK